MCSEHSLSTLFVKVSGDRLVNALQPQWVALVLHTRTCCSYLFRLAALWKKRKKKTVIFGTFLYACIASDIGISRSFCLFLTFRDQPLENTQFHLVNMYLVLNSCVSLGIMDGFTSLTRPWRWTKTTRWRKEGRKASRQAGRQAGRQAVTLQSQRKRNYVPLVSSCLHVAGTWRNRALFNVRDACGRRDLVATVQPPSRSFCSRKQIQGQPTSPYAKTNLPTVP